MVNTPQLLASLDRQSQSFWYNGGVDIDLNIRQMMSGAREQPYITADGFQPAIAEGIKAGQPREHVMKSLARTAFAAGRIMEQEERLQGRNRQATHEQRVYLWLLAGGACTYCEVSLEYKKMQADHRQPFYLDGPTLVHNLACACNICNKAKGLGYDSQYRRAIEEHPGGLIAGRNQAYKDMLEARNPATC